MKLRLLSLMGMLISALFVNAQELKKSPFSANWTVLTDSSYIQDFKSSPISDFGEGAINSIAFSKDGTMYLAYEGKGIFSLKDGDLKLLSEANSGSLRRVAVDGKGRLWSCSTGYLSVFEENKWRYFKLCESEEQFEEANVPLQHITDMVAGSDGVYLTGRAFISEVNKEGEDYVTETATTVFFFDGDESIAISDTNNVGASLMSNRDLLMNLKINDKDEVIGIYTTSPSLSVDEKNYFLVQIRDKKMEVVEATTKEAPSETGSKVKKLLDQISLDGLFSMHDLTFYDEAALIADNGTTLYSYKNNTWEEYLDLKTFDDSQTKIRAIEGLGDQLWIATDKSVFLLNGKKVVQQFDLTKGHFLGKNTRIYDMVADHQGKIWFLDGGLPKNNFKNVTPPKKGYSNTGITQVSSISAGPNYEMFAPTWSLVNDSKELDLLASTMQVDGENIRLDKAVIKKVVDGKEVDVVTVPGKDYLMKHTQGQDGTLFIYDKDQVHQYSEGKLTKLLEGQDPKLAKGFKGVWKLADGEIWIRAAKGMFVISVDNSVQFYTKKNDGGLPTTKPYQVFQASNGVKYMRTLWKNYKQIDGQWLDYKSAGSGYIEGENGVVYSPSGSSYGGIYEQTEKEVKNIKYNEKSVVTMESYQGANGGVWFIGNEAFYYLKNGELIKFDEWNSTLRGSWIDAVIVKDGKDYLKCIIKDFTPPKSATQQVVEPVPVKKEKFIYGKEVTWAVFNSSEVPVSVIEEEE
ncbi:hypothetical protein [Persicobacter psychrovividus]|uniref:Uncharacterized protein n=1 Tax=Persicobacter psychrovividus TaxID=387638 RepID=A0ABN6LEM6_9BACT|nr:hypothetical protein PEPS_21590 [Persicobacter psychrovividus]